MASFHLKGLCTCVHFVMLLNQASSSKGRRSNDYDFRGQLMHGISDEKKLVNILMSDYKKLGVDGRPVYNSTTAVHVEFGVGLISMEIEEKENTLSMSAWCRFKWLDEYLRWNPADFNGVDTVKLPSDRIWIPDIMLYNTANTEEFERRALAMVDYDGTVRWFPHKVFKSSCSLDVSNYPFDNQTCHMVFGSWTHNSSQLDLTAAFSRGIDLSTFLSDYKDSSTWEILNVTSERHAEEYAFLIFSLFFKRKLMFSSYILTMPAIFLAFLTLVVFWLPAEEADKSALGLTIFGSLLMLLLILVQASPPTASAIPLLGIFYCFTTVIVILSVFLSSLVVKIGKGKARHKRRVPTWVKHFVFNGLGRLLLLDKYTDVDTAKQTATTSGSGKAAYVPVTLVSRREAARDTEAAAVGPHGGVEKETCLCGGGGGGHGQSLVNGTNSGYLRELQLQVRSMHDLVEDLAKKHSIAQQREKYSKGIDEEWRHLACIMDRLFSAVYLVAIVIALVCWFPRP